MQVKTFEALTMNDAIKSIKSEFGNDAIILNTKEKILDNKNKMYEVTAAIPETTGGFGAEAGKNLFDRKHLNDEVSDQLQSLDQKISNLIDVMPRKNNFNNLEGGVEELKSLLIESLRTKEDHIISKIPKSMTQLYRQLSLTGIDESILTKLTSYLKDLPEPAEIDNKIPVNMSDFFQSQAIRWMLKRITIAPKWTPVSGTTKIRAFVGPSGSGKTTAIAKLAAKYHKQHRAKILLVSFDQSKLASSEQLRLYSKIVGIPFETINNAQELEKILDKSNDLDMVFIDTAGRSPKNIQLIEELNLFQESSLPIDFHLVLSITEKQAQLDRSIRNFSTLGLESLIFTKIDESWSYGEIFNLSTKWSLPLSFFSTGQKIPDDIERASKERVVERIFGL